MSKKIPGAILVTGLAAILIAVIIAGALSGTYSSGQQQAAAESSQAPPPRIKSLATPAPILGSATKPPPPHARCGRLTATDAKNITKEFLLVVGQTYAETDEAKTCTKATFSAVSPVTKQRYEMTCTPETSNRLICTGANNAWVAFEY